MNKKLKLGPLPDVTTVRMTVTLPSVLKAQLDVYADAHSKAYGASVEVGTLIPLMLAQFLAADKQFQRTLRRPSGP